MVNDQGGAHSLDSEAGRGDAPSPRTAEPRSERDHDSRHVRSIGDRHNQRDREPQNIDHRSVTAAQKEQYGGIKIGSAFFGWLTATGMAVLLTALLAAIGAGVGVVKNIDATKASNTATNNATTVGIIGAVALLVIVLVAYYCGGYVAGRMARFNGIRQGIAVWLWALVIVVVLAIIAATAGDKYNVLSKLNVFPRIPVKEGTLTTTGIIALIAVAIASLIGSILGGLAGMHYHRKIDKTPVRPTA